MDPKELNKSLVELRDELKRMASLDAGSRAALKKLDEDIHLVLEASGDVPADSHVGLRRSLEDSIEYFEASHPTAVGLVNRLLKALSDMGV